MKKHIMTGKGNPGPVGQKLNTPFYLSWGDLSNSTKFVNGTQTFCKNVHSVYLKHLPINSQNVCQHIKTIFSFWQKMEKKITGSR